MAAKKAPRPTRVKRAYLRALDALAELASEVPAGPERRAIEGVALNAILALGEQAGATVVGAPSAERFARALNVLSGGRPTYSDGLSIRRAASILLRATAGSDEERARALGMAPITTDLLGSIKLPKDVRAKLAGVDEAFDKADVAGALARLRRGDALSGVLTDLLIETRALGTTAGARRHDVQKRVDSALRNPAHGDSGLQ